MCPVGAIGTVIAPVLAAIGALTAVMNQCTIEVEKVEHVDENKSA